MSDFQVRIVRVHSIDPIPDADRIEVATIGDYRCVTQKGRFQPGDQAVYIPEAAMLPRNLLEQLDLVGKLAGPDGNRIKAVKLRGVVSQGLLLQLPEVGIDPEGPDIYGDLAETLGIIKWDPPIPVEMQGEVTAMFGKTVHYDIENFKTHPDVLQEGEEIEFTEKLHGTFCAVTLDATVDDDEMPNRNILVYSKGLGKQGFVFKDVEANAGNLYLRIVKEAGIIDRLKQLAVQYKYLTLFGEIYGRGVQDLQYGLKKPEFAVFDAYMGKPGEGIYMGREYLDIFCKKMGLARVPVIYQGPFSRDVMHEYTNGKTIRGGGAHIREGIVMTPKKERHDTSIGRVILKSVSPDYLFRKGNQTEFN